MHVQTPRKTGTIWTKIEYILSRWIGRLLFKLFFDKNVVELIGYETKRKALFSNFRDENSTVAEL